MGILFKCEEKTNVILIHCIELDVNVDDLLLREDDSEDKIPFRKRPWFHEANQYLVIELRHALSAEKAYTLDAEFAAPLGLDVSGFYRTSYETNDETRYAFIFKDGFKSSAECKKVVSDIFGEIEFLMEYQNIR